MRHRESSVVVCSVNLSARRRCEVYIFSGGTNLNEVGATRNSIQLTLTEIERKGGLNSSMHHTLQYGWAQPAAVCTTVCRRNTAFSVHDD